jgi:teichuronic acid exporter
LATVAQNQTPGRLNLDIRSAYVWTVGGSITKNVVGFGISVVLARLLQPSDYGLLGMVWVFIAILSAVQDLGLGQAIVHFNDDESAIPTYFTTTLLLGLILTTVSFGTAPWVANFYNQPRLTVIIQVLSSILTIGSLQSVAIGVLSKHFRFRELTLIEMSSTIGAGCIGVLAAFWGYGVWSLVLNLLLSSVFQTVLLCRAVPPRFTGHLRRDVLRRVLRFGLPLTGGGLLHQFYDNADYLTVGKMLGAAPLGLYTLAFRLATLAHEKIAVVVNKVAFPSFAAMQGEPGTIIDHWFEVSRAVSLINFPLLLGLFINARDLILVVFGQKWLPAVVPLRFLCVAGALRSMVHIVLHIYNATGRTGLRLQFGILNATILPLSFVIGCKAAGIAGVGLAWCVVYPFIWAFALIKARGFLSFSFLRYFASFRLPAVAALACGIGMLPADLIHHSPISRLCVRLTLGSISFAIFAFSRKRIRNEVCRLFKREVWATEH